MGLNTSTSVRLRAWGQGVTRKKLPKLDLQELLDLFGFDRSIARDRNGHDFAGKRQQERDAFGPGFVPEHADNERKFRARELLL